MEGDDPFMNAENARAKHVRTHLKFDLHNYPYDSRHGERRNTKEKPQKGAVGEGGRYKVWNPTKHDDTSLGEAKARREGT